MAAPRDYQQACHDAVLSAWGEKPWHQDGDVYRSVVANLTTSAGKTFIAGMLIQSVRERGKCLYLADTDELCAQPVEKFYKLFKIHAAIEKAGERASGLADVVVGSAQTLARKERLARYDPAHFKYIFVDEAHRGSPRNKEIYDYFPAAKVMGMTATAFRAKLKDLSDFYDAVAFEMGLFDLIDEGYITPLKILTLPVKVDISGVHQRMSSAAGGMDYDANELDTTIRPYYEEICRMVVEHAANRRIVAYLPLIKSSQEFVHIAKVAGIDARHIDGKSTDRKQLLDDFEAGKFQMLCNSSLLTTGWDCLDAETEILTFDGWKGMGQVRIGEMCWALNPATGQAEIVRVDDYGEREVRPDEQMFSIESQYMNIRTTEGHRFYVQYRDPAKRGQANGKYLVKTGRVLAGQRSQLFPLSATGHFEELRITDDELRFVAWLMTDGYVLKDGSASIAQSKAGTTGRIGELLARLGFAFRVRNRIRTSSYGSGQLTEFRIPRRAWGHLAPFYSKALAPVLSTISVRQFDLFWSELLLGDGEKCEGRHGWLWCNNQAFADRLMAMAVVRGYSTSCQKRITKNNFTMFRVGCRKKELMQVGANRTKPTRVALSEAVPGEVVWCVSNRLQTIFIRRRGKVSIVGNCPPCDCLLNMAPTRSAGLFRQKVGRIGRILPGIIDGITDKDARKAAIAASAKPDSLILDLLWQTQRFGLMGPSDLVAGNEEEKAAIQGRLAGLTSARDLQEVSAEVQREREEALKQALIAAAARRSKFNDAINLVAAMLHSRKVTNYQPVSKWETQPVTEKQKNWLAKQGIDPESGLDRGHVSAFMNLIFGRKLAGLCSHRCVELLEKAGVAGAISFTSRQAFEVLGGNYPCSFGTRTTGRPLRSISTSFWEWCYKQPWFKMKFPIEYEFATGILKPDGGCTCIGAYQAPNCPVHPRVSTAEFEPTSGREVLDLFEVL